MYGKLIDSKPQETSTSCSASSDANTSSPLRAIPLPQT